MQWHWGHIFGLLASSVAWEQVVQYIGMPISQWNIGSVETSINQHIAKSFTKYRILKSHSFLCAFTDSHLPPLFVFCLFLQLAEVNDGSLMCSAVLSPLSHVTALLTILQPGITQCDQLLTTEIIAPATAETSADLPDVVSSVLAVVYDIMEEDGDSVDGKDYNEADRV